MYTAYLSGWAESNPSWYMKQKGILEPNDPKKKATQQNIL